MEEEQFKKASKARELSAENASNYNIQLAKEYINEAVSKGRFHAQFYGDFDGSVIIDKYFTPLGYKVSFKEGTGYGQDNIQVSW